jgi:nucleotide-binding universal stress UspA family protein
MTSTSQSGWRILAPLDGSPHAQRGLTYATELARVSHGQIKLIRAGDPDADSGSNSLEHTAQRLQQPGVSVDWTIVDSNDAVSAILDAAQVWPADAIVMATSKTSAFDRWLNGSVTDAVIRSAHVPVVVVPPEWDRPVQPGRPLHVLVPLDGSSRAEQVLPVVLHLATAAPITVVLLRAARAEDAGSDGAETYVRDIGSRLEDVLGVGRVTTQVGEGPPATVILEAAQKFDVDAIAMCTHGRSGMSRSLLGSTATATLEHSSVPLLLVGPGALEEPTTAQIRLRAPVRNKH